MSTVRKATFDLLRQLGLTTIFGNPGSTEEPFLEDFPEDFTYVLALQEASAVAMADGFAQATGTVALVNLHTAPGVGNALGNLVNTRATKTPMILTAGQQTREMLLLEPWLTNVDATSFPKPHVKWSYETARAEETPAAMMRAYAAALQPPAGPVFLSLPMDDWAKSAEGAAEARSVASRVGPDPDRLARFAEQFSAAKNAALVIGADVDRSGAWEEAIAFAEKTGVPVYSAPVSERVGFPETHPQFAGPLPFAIDPLRKELEGYDLVLVVGAPVFRYYPYVAGKYLPRGCRLLHITDNPEEAARAPVGDSLISNARLALRMLLELVKPTAREPYRRAEEKASAPTSESAEMTIDEVFTAVAAVRPAEMVVVNESPSNMKQIHTHLPTSQPRSFFSMASGGLGFGLPAAVGIGLAERAIGSKRPVLAIIGDGSLQYSIQALWTAAQHKVKMVVLVPVNTEYAILKSFAKQEDTPDVPGLDLPEIDIAGLAAAYGCHAENASTPEEVQEQVRAAFDREGPTVIAAKVTSEVPPLL